jgi:hypothetical protein
MAFHPLRLAGRDAHFTGERGFLRVAQETGDGVIVDLVEVVVVRADRAEVERGVVGDDLVGDVRVLLDPVRRCRRHGEHHPLGALQARHVARGFRSRAGGDAVVDDHRGAAAQRRTLTRRAKPADAFFDLVSFALFGALDFVVLQTDAANDVVVQHAHAALAHRAEGELGVPRHAELAHDQHVEWSMQRLCYFVGHGHTAARQAEYERVVAGQVFKSFGELSSGVGAVMEHDGEFRRVPRESKQYDGHKLRYTRTE